MKILGLFVGVMALVGLAVFIWPSNSPQKVTIDFGVPADGTSVVDTGELSTASNDSVNHHDEVPSGVNAPKVEKRNSHMTERYVLGYNDGVLEADRVNGILSSPSFHDVVERFKDEQLENPAATALTEAYRELFDVYHEIDGSADFALNELSCGESLCIGSLETYDSGETWRRLVTEHLGKNGDAKFGSMISYPVPIDDTTTEQRFAFTTDPQQNVIFDPLESGDLIYFPREDGNGSGTGGGSGDEPNPGGEAGSE
ncbi:hypothetical protein [Elongatibacter sediminis]|uniref:Uncharacterized protein n=1 Tax=Elongatibacter sediminis TaxID=3119006 RepID=A0AAW9RKC9_9GAMM